MTFPRVLLPVLLLSAALGAAIWLQSELVESEADDYPPESATEEKAGAEDVLRLRIGGSLPRLRLPNIGTAAQGQPERDPVGVTPDPLVHIEPNTTPPRTKGVVLRRGETIYGICLREFGSSRRVGEILALNGLTEADARRLRPGTTIRMP